MAAIKKIINLIKRLFRKPLTMAQYIDKLRANGVKIGENADIINSVLDVAHGYLISIGNNVTITNATILTHDASLKKTIGYSKIGRVEIGNDVFVGYGAIILPNVKIGNNVIIGAGSVVTHDIPDNSVAVGSPARVVGSYSDTVKKNQERINAYPTYNTDYSVGISEEEKIQVNEALKKSGWGFDL